MNTTATTRIIHNAAEAERVMAIAKALHGMRDKPSDLVVTAMRAARERSPRMMQVLEETTEEISAHVERQMGDSIRTHTASNLQRTFEPSEVGTWRAAYEAADKGTPAEPLMWYYAAAGIVAGLAPPDDRTRAEIRDYLTRNNL